MVLSAVTYSRTALRTRLVFRSSEAKEAKMSSTSFDGGASVRAACRDACTVCGGRSADYGRGALNELGRGYIWEARPEVDGRARSGVTLSMSPVHFVLFTKTSESFPDLVSSKREPVGEKQSRSRGRSRFRR
jgi:hypothetical protein